ncbi:hypothetical protein Bca52824_072581 [Brassica carinata]|uniref:Uncharacterized protein n=1 Tax=Brassica carinata TaxID=52824 RepID=A0A8X7U4E1_BRACI|nr:hypothetical protein Bca52824_072581 [Brassica carinata]
MKLQETEGIEEYHRWFELLRTDLKLPEADLVKAYLQGLEMDTQRHIQMVQSLTIDQCFPIGRLYEQSHPKKDQKLKADHNKDLRQVPFEIQGTKMIVSADSKAQVETESIPVIQCSILDRESNEYVDSLKTTEEFHELELVGIEDNLVCALERANRVWKPGRLLCSFIQLGWLVRAAEIHENDFSSEETRKIRDMDLCFFQSLMLKNTHMLVFRVDESAAGQI